MFNPADETEKNWEREIEEDVKVECSKYGKVCHIAVDPRSAGHIYLKFDSIEAATRAIKALDGRYFAGKSVSAVFVSDTVYYATYPIAASK